MIKRLQKSISILLITALLFGRGFSVLPIFAEDPAPTSTQTVQPTDTPSTAVPQPTTGDTSGSSQSQPSPTQALSKEELYQQKLATLTQNLAEVQRKVDAIYGVSSNTTGNTASSPTANPSPEGSSGPNGPSPTGTATDSGPTIGADGTMTNADGSTADAAAGSVNDPANTNTGPGSLNESYEILNQKMEILNQNLAQVQNKVDAITSSGFNYANLNTMQGQIITGDTVSSVNLLNKLNSNMTGLGAFEVFNVYGNYSGDIVFKMADGNADQSFNNASTNVAKNVNTGTGSSNTADSTGAFTVKEANGNDAQLSNDITLNATTGGNIASFNTGGGDITSGDAFASGNVVNMTNTNLNVSKWLIGVVNVFGTLAGNIILPQDSSTSDTTSGTSGVLTANANTGPGSTNTATFNNATTESFQNANTANVTSNVDVMTNTGNNTASANTGGGSVTTGNSQAAVSNSTVANTNTVDEDGTVWMIIVNEGGKWVGKIIGNPWGSTAASNTLPISQQTGGAGTQTYNANTGPLSTNNSTYNTTSDTSVTNNNTAGITNNISGIADSGNNQSSYNTGAGNIETGDAKVGLNLVNMANTNVTAKKFIAVFVNVLGNFLGDVLPPDQQTGNTTLTDSASPVQVSPTPVLPQLPAFNTDLPNIGGIGVGIIAAPTPVQDAGNETINQIADNTQQFSTDPVITDSGNVQTTYYYYPQEYYQAVQNVKNSKKKIAIQAKNLVQENYILGQQVKNTSRGIFISAAFAKATESTFPGILLGGASLRVTPTWLSVVPLAFLIVALRRKRKFQIDMTKYLNAILDIVL